MNSDQAPDQEYRANAEAGQAEAQYKLGRMYAYGEGVPKDETEAANWLQKSVDQGYASAQALLAYLYQSGETLTHNYAMAQTLLEKAAEQGQEYAITQLGRMYFYGIGGLDQDYSKAASWIEKSAALKDPEGLHLIGYLYHKGHVLPQDKVKASQYYMESAELGSAGAQYELGKLYAEGDGFSKDESEAIHWLEKSVEQNHTPALVWLSHVLQTSEIRRDYERALDLLLKAAEKEDEHAIKTLGWMYFYGRCGVDKNYQKALPWLQKAIALNDSDSMEMLAIMYKDGQGVVKDEARMFELLRQAAALGNVYSMTYIGYAYCWGRGLEKDYNQAMDWLRRAVELGDEDAKDYLSQLYLCGHSTEENFDLALKWYCAGELPQNHFLFTTCEGLALAERSCDLKREKIMAWLEQRVDQHVVCLRNLANLYEDKNLPHAIELYLRAANMGDIPSQLKAAWQLMHNDRTPETIAEGVKWLRRAIEQQSPEAMTRMAFLYKIGWGVEEDQNKYQTLIRQAAELDYAEAIQEVAKFPD